MMQKMAFRRLFSSLSYNTSSNPKVFLEVTKNGVPAGKMVFQLYANHSPNLAENFADLCNGGDRSFVGTKFSKGHAGLGIQGGDLREAENWGAGLMRLPDENLEMRHHKRGLLTMLNNGPHSNGSQFLVTFGEATHLDGYHNIVGELIDGEYVLSSIEQDCQRNGKVHNDWAVSSSGTQY